MVRVGLTAERLARAGAEPADEVGFDQVTAWIVDSLDALLRNRATP